MTHSQNTLSTLVSKLVSALQTSRLFALAVIAFLTMTTFVLPAISRAQCPDSTGPQPNPSLYPWMQASVSATIGGTACNITIYFCYRDIPGPPDTLQLWQDSVVVDSSISCDSIPDSAIIVDSRLLLDSAVAQQFGKIIQPCDGGYDISEEFSPSCWTPTSTTVATHSGVKLSGCESNIYCTKICHVCFDATLQTLVFSDCQIQGPPIDAICTQGEPWIPGGCYWADCFEGTFKETSHGLLPAQSDETLQAFPNPASTILTVTSSISGENIQLLDVLGKEVTHGTIGGNGILTFDVSKFSAGTYFILAGQTEVQFVKK